MKEHAKKCKSNTKVLVGGGNEVSMDCDCDGYHTFNELYEHRVALYIAVAGIIKRQENACGYIPTGESFVWKSKRHSDGELAFGGTWFVLGIGKEKGNQITYHLPIEKWDETDFAETLEKAPEFDGHTSDDVLERLKSL